jgi:antitoxin YefM
MIAIAIDKLKQELPDLASKAKKGESNVIVLEDDKTAMLMSQEEYESYKETEEILADPQLMKDLKEAEQEIAEGKGIPWEQVKRELGWK